MSRCFSKSYNNYHFKYSLVPIFVSRSLKNLRESGKIFVANLDFQACHLKMSKCFRVFTILLVKKLCHYLEMSEYLGETCYTHMYRVPTDRGKSGNLKK